MNFRGKTTVTPAQCYTHANNILLETVGNKDDIRRVVNAIYVNSVIQGLNAGLCVSAWCIDALLGETSPIRYNNLEEYINQFMEMEVTSEVEAGYNTMKKINVKSIPTSIEGTNRIVIAGLPIKKDKSGKSATIGNFELGDVIEAVPVDLSWGALYSGGFVNINPKYSFPIAMEHITDSEREEELAIGTMFHCTGEEIPLLYGAGTNYYQTASIKHGDIIKVETSVAGWPIISVKKENDEYETLGFLNYKKYKDQLKEVVESNVDNTKVFYVKEPIVTFNDSFSDVLDEHNSKTENTEMKTITTLQVRSGEYRNETYAENRKNKLESAGFTCEIKRKAPFYYCILLETDDMNKAKSMCRAARKKGFPTSIHHLLPQIQVF